MSFLNPEERQTPYMLMMSLADGGNVICQLGVAIVNFGIVLSTPSATGVPTSFAVMLSSASSSSLLFALMIAVWGCITLGIWMPKLSAHMAINSVLRATLQSFETDLLAARVSSFSLASQPGYPPVTLTTFAASSV